MELTCLVFQIVNFNLIQHYDVMVSVLTEQAFETNWAKISFAKGFDIFTRMDFALIKVLISVGTTVICSLTCVLAKADIQFIVRIVCHVTCMDVFAFPVNSLESLAGTTADSTCQNASLVWLRLYNWLYNLLLLLLFLRHLVYCSAYLIIVISLHFFCFKLKINQKTEIYLN